MKWSSSARPRHVLSATCLLAGVVLLVLSGCHSPRIKTQVHNGGSQALSLVEVDYPSASFGIESLPVGSTFRYSLKVLGSGNLSVTWTDASHQTHTVKGPPLDEGQEGTLVLDLTQTTVTWNLHLKH